MFPAAPRCCGPGTKAIVADPGRKQGKTKTKTGFDDYAAVVDSIKAR